MDTKEGYSNQRVTRFPGAEDFRTPTFPPTPRGPWSTSDTTSQPPSYRTAQENGVGTNVGGQTSHENTTPQDWAHEASRVAARNALQQAKRISFHKSARQKRKPKPFAQTLRPGIKVDTNCSRHQASAPRQIFPQSTPSANAEEKKGVLIMTLRPQAGLERNLGITPFGNEQSHQQPHTIDSRADTNTHSIQESLHPTRMTLSDISPSDRPITIGISVSPEMVSEHEASPATAHPTTQYATQPATRERSTSGASATTPKITITPAQESPKWTLLAPPAPSSKFRARPTSSIYSRATNGYMYGSAPSDVPPVPFGGFGIVSHRGLPETAKGEGDHGKTEYSSHGAYTSDTKERVTSAATLFEEDQSPASAAKKPSKAAPGLYIDTSIPPTPRRSQGWWNVILTPFIITPSRWKFSPNSEKSTPDVPILPAAATFSRTEHASADPQPGNVYINNHHYYGFPHEHGAATRAPIARSDTSLSSDTTPVVAVASIGTVLNARSVNEPQAVNEMPRALERAEVRNPSRMDSTSQPATAHDPIPYFAPPPMAAYQRGAAYESNDTPTRGGTLRPFPVQRSMPERKDKAQAPWKKGAGGYWHLFSRKKKGPDLNQPPVEKKKKKSRRCCCCCLIFLILLIILLAVLLGVFIPRSHHSDSSSSSSSSSSSGTGTGSSSPTASDTPSNWLNLTGFPPIPTGVATIARPENNYAQSGCVSPQTMWSCAVPKDEQAALEPNEPDQPNFQVRISFVNGTVSNTTALQPLVSKRSEGSIQRSEESFLHKLLARAAAPTASPVVPSLEDQTFLGNTTDGNSEPYAGEETPFFITFLSGEGTSYRLAKRDDSDDSGDSSNSTIASIIPAPAIMADGTAAPANLLAFPSNQPLRLFNRGQANEHYGFYTYYDRSIFLKNNIAVNVTDTGEIAADANGGSTKDAARVRCTWRDTRFVVKIWTNSDASKPLLASTTSSSSSTTTTTIASASASSSAINDFSRPGSFPAPISISLDRHGGNITQKMIYCYGIEDDGHVNKSSGMLNLEQRAFGGSLVNPAQGPYGDVNVTVEEGGPGGIDGGVGGCGCGWRNWEG
ncbi:hypothetical protein K490DRAFT_40469 [Saccharata proteae CBS 121410]|uniref:Glycoprotease family protein n=1 Tax=Saccharata proteae CBS 121410 TaxID=1314787 RepID=A0A9P4HZW4_9PEZI|nr:hypothetical protein K490DRAFT_40469 [Saccharata proteae CBS 121410]